MDAYARLVELARRERELVQQARYDELTELLAEHDALVAGLAGPAPAAARPFLEEALELSRANELQLEAGLDRLRHELVALGQHRHVVRSYGGVTPRATLDASA